MFAYLQILQHNRAFAHLMMVLDIDAGLLLLIHPAGQIGDLRMHTPLLLQGDGYATTQHQPLKHGDVELLVDADGVRVAVRLQLPVVADEYQVAHGFGETCQHLWFQNLGRLFDNLHRTPTA